MTFAEVLEQAIAEQPLTLDRIAARLEVGTPVSVSTLSYWQRGRTVPKRFKSRKVLAELDHILNLRPGTLEGALTDNPDWSLQEVLPGAEETEQILAEWEMDALHTWTRISTFDHLVVDKHGRESSQRARQILRADVDGAQRFPIVLQQDSDVEGCVPALRALTGLEIDEVRLIPDQHITIGSATTLRPLRRGELVAVEYEAVWGPQVQRAFRWDRSIPHQAQGLAVEVEFHCELPRKIWRYHIPAGAPEEDAIRFDDVLVHGPWIQCLLITPEAGIHGVEWEW